MREMESAGFNLAHNPIDTTRPALNPTRIQREEHTPHPGKIVNQYISHVYAFRTYRVGHDNYDEDKRKHNGALPW